jgi:hypothetical protein
VHFMAIILPGFLWFKVGLVSPDCKESAVGRKGRAAAWSIVLNAA